MDQNGQSYLEWTDTPQKQDVADVKLDLTDSRPVEKNWILQVPNGSKIPQTGTYRDKLQYTYQGLLMRDGM